MGIEKRDFEMNVDGGFLNIKINTVTMAKEVLPTILNNQSGQEMRDFKSEISRIILLYLQEFFPDITEEDIHLVDNKKDGIGYTFPLFGLAKKLKIDVIELNKLLTDEQNKE